MAIKWSAFSAGSAIQDADTTVGLQSGGNVRWAWSAVKTYILGAATAVLSIAAGKTLTASNTLTFTGTDGSSVAFGTGGTVQYQGGALGAASATSLTFSSTSGIIGTTTNDNAAAGSVGQYISSNVVIGSAVSLTTTVTANVTSIALTAGDWDVWGAVAFTPNALTSVTVLNGSVSTTSATSGALNNGSFVQFATAANVMGANDTILTLAPARMSVAGATTVYLTATGTFTVNALAAYGILQARRRR